MDLRKKSRRLIVLPFAAAAVCFLLSAAIVGPANGWGINPFFWLIGCLALPAAMAMNSYGAAAFWAFLCALIAAIRAAKNGCSASPNEQKFRLQAGISLFADAAYFVLTLISAFLTK